MKELRNAHCVPWADRSEWKEVREKIMSENIEDLRRAYEIMSIWKLRSDKLPTYVDCTAEILQVMVQDYLCETSGYNDQDLRLSYSTALIRFVNHVHDVSEFRNNSLYSAARIQNIPDWIITMRHDAAHGRHLPTLETFHLAAKVSLQWLLKNYWFQEELYLSDLDPVIREAADEAPLDNLNLSLLPIYKTAIKILEVCSDATSNSFTRISALPLAQFCYIIDLVNLCKANNNISENELKCIKNVEKCIHMYEKCQVFPKKKGMGITDLKKVIFNLIKCITNDEKAKYTFVESVLQSGFMLDTAKKEWSEIICLIQSVKGLNILLKSLFELVADNNDMALDLLNSLFLSIQALKSQWLLYLNVTKHKSREEDHKRIIRKYAKGCRHLKFPLRLETPPKIELEALQELIENPTDQSGDLICNYLTLVEPPLTEPLFNQVKTLIHIYCGSNLVSDKVDVNEKMYTLEDIKLGVEEKDVTPLLVTEDTSSETESWVRSDISAEVWSCCPLGLLPDQKVVDCNLPEELKWKRVEFGGGRKRAGGNPLLKHLSPDMKKLREMLKDTREIIDKN